MTLDQVLQARRTMDFLATSGKPDMFNLAKEDYFSKLKQYHDETENKDTVQQWFNTEIKRAKQLSLFNSTGSVDVGARDNEEVRERPSSFRE